MIHLTDREEHLWSLFDRPGLLIGPLPYRRSKAGSWVPDYRHPGVAERIAAEVDFIETLCYDKRKL